MMPEYLPSQASDNLYNSSPGAHNNEEEEGEEGV